MFLNQVSPSNSQLAELQSYPKDTPIVMFNILRFKAKTSTNETGEEVYARYFKNASAFMKNSGAKLIWKGKVHTTVIGDSELQPQVVFLIEYPTVNRFFKMISDPEYQKIAKERSLALEYGGLLACQTTD